MKKTGDRKLSRQRFKTFVTEQKFLLFMQIMILIGLAVEVGMFFALLWYGRPPATNIDQILQFFTVSALWVIVINMGIVLFWWVSKHGAWPVQIEAETDESN